MYQLPCPQCQTPIPVAPSQAGDRTPCPSCGGEVAIPTLGQLKRLPVSETGADEAPQSELTSTGGPTAKRVGFVVLAMIATATLLIAGFAAIRWSLIETPITSEGHINELREAYKTLTPAELIREYEQMEKYALDMVVPYPYQTVALEKARWGWIASISGAIAGFAVIGAIGLAAGGRRNQRSSADT
jgi:hypothetical protein